MERAWRKDKADLSAIGRGNEIVCFAIEEISKRIVGMDAEEIFADMGAFWNFREYELAGILHRPAN